MRLARKRGTCRRFAVCRHWVMAPNLFAKLGVNARAEAAAVAVRRGLV
jgi:hypothetical protein